MTTKAINGLVSKLCLLQHPSGRSYKPLQGCCSTPFPISKAYETLLHMHCSQSELPWVDEWLNGNQALGLHVVGSRARGTSGSRGGLGRHGAGKPGPVMGLPETFPISEASYVPLNDLFS